MDSFVFSLYSAILMLQEFGRIPKYSNTNFISNLSTANVFTTKPFQLHNVLDIHFMEFGNESKPIEFKFDNTELVVVDDTFDHNRTLTIIQNLINQPSNSLILVQWKEATMNDIEIMFSNLPFSKRIQLSATIYFISNKTIFESYSIGNTVSFRSVEGCFMTHQKDFYGQQLIGSHVQTWNINSKNGKETLKIVDRLRHVNMEYEVLSYTQDFLNFSLQTMRASERARISVDHTKIKRSWTGITYQILHGLSDFAITDSPVLPQTARDFRFVTPHTLTRQAKMLYSMKQNTIVNPYGNVFSKHGWYCIVILLILCLLCRIVLSNLESRWDSFIWAVAIVSQQSWEEKVPSATSQRILTLSMSILCLILYTMFCSGLISSLSVGTKQDISVRDLVKLGYKFGVANTSYLIIAEHTNNNSMGRKYEFLTDFDEVFKNLHPKMTFPSTADGMKYLINTAGYGFIGVSWTNFLTAVVNYSHIWNNDRICEEMKTLTITEYNFRFSSIFRKDSPYLEFFKYSRITMKERGIESIFQNRLKSDGNLLNPSCKAKEALVSFHLVDVIKPFSILIAGMVSSIFILIMEVMIGQHGNRKVCTVS